MPPLLLVAFQALLVLQCLQHSLTHDSSIANHDDGLFSCETMGASARLTIHKHVDTEHTPHDLHFACSSVGPYLFAHREMLLVFLVLLRVVLFRAQLERL